jgi:SAM-dependent methyltransferase
MLNFGYWTEKTTNPLQAQQELCTIVGEFAKLYSASDVLDVGSGFSAPALHWKRTYNSLNIVCVNINLQQLLLSAAAARTYPNVIVNYNRSGVTPSLSSALVENCNTTITSVKDNNIEESISRINATATILPFADHCIDRIIALESAQHFRPLNKFVRESKRILKNNGLLVIAIPVAKITTPTITRSQTNKTTQLLIQLRKLGLLSLTWASEHYELSNVKSVIMDEGFGIQEIQEIGSHVYEPLAKYYTENRKMLKDIIMKQKYPSSLSKDILYDFIENIIYKSALSMKEASQRKIIDYVLIKAINQ